MHKHTTVLHYTTKFSIDLSAAAQLAKKPGRPGVSGS